MSSQSSFPAAGEFHGIAVEPDDPEQLFTVITVLGRGAYGSVYKVQNKKTGEIVAAKEIPNVSDEELQAVRREIQMLQECAHPNVVRYRGTYRTMGALWITMEYCAGGSIDNILKVLKTPLAEEQIQYVCREMLKGLQYLHANHKIHRDIKGGNVLLTDTGDVKLSDFGVAVQLMNTMSRRNSFIGTLYWMSPEAIQEKEYDHRADIWSLGITVIELAELAPPHSDMHYARALFQIPAQPPPQLQSRDMWSPAMHRFVARCLVKDPARRPSATELLSDPFVANCRGTANHMIALLDEYRIRTVNMSTARRLGEESSSEESTQAGPRSEQPEVGHGCDNDANGEEVGGGAAAEEGDAAGDQALDAAGNGVSDAEPQPPRPSCVAGAAGAAIKNVATDGRPSAAVAADATSGVAPQHPHGRGRSASAIVAGHGAGGGGVGVNGANGMAVLGPARGEYTSLVDVPFLSLDDLSLDELGKPTTDVDIRCLVSDRDRLWEGAGSDSFMSSSAPRLNHVTEVLIQQVAHFQDGIYAQGVTKEEIERARALVTKCGGVLKSLLRI